MSVDIQSKQAAPFESIRVYRIGRLMYKMAVKEKQTESSFEEIEWNVENEIQLFFSMNGHKPVGKMQKPT